MSGFESKDSDSAGALGRKLWYADGWHCYTIRSLGCAEMPQDYQP